jgi:prophage regulatory protein
MCNYVHVVPDAIWLYVLPCPLAGINQWASTLLMEMSMTKVRKLVSKKELRTVHGIPYSFAHIARLEKAAQFPKRLVLGACRVAWWEDEVEEWKASRPRAA